MPNQIIWRWPSFKPEEVLSPQGLSAYLNQGILLFSPIMLTALSQFRAAINQPILINHGNLRLRGFRSCEENASVSGGKLSMHLQGIAADCTIKGVSPENLAKAAEASGLFSGIGLYPEKGFVHLDIRLTTDGIIRKWVA